MISYKRDVATGEDTIDGYEIIADDLDPTLGTYRASGNFNLVMQHQFVLFSYEGLNKEPSGNTADEDTGVIEGTGKSIGLFETHVFSASKY